MVRLNLPRRGRAKPKVPPLCYIAAFALYQVTFDEWLAWVQHIIYGLQPIPPHLEALVSAIVWVGGPKHPVRVANGIRAVRATVFKIGLERWTQVGVVKHEITSSGLHNDPLHRDPLGDHYIVIMRDANGRKTLGSHADLPGAFGQSNGKPIPRRQPRTQDEFRGKERKWFKWEETIRVQVTAQQMDQVIHFKSFL